MGKAIPRYIKTRAKQLLEFYPKKFSKNHEENKKLLEELDLPLTKLEKNLVAAFITREITKSAK